MALTDAARSAPPPALARWLRRARLLAWHLARFHAPTWTGPYARFADVPVRGPGFSGAVWVDGTRAATARAIAAMRARRMSPLGPLGEHGLLPLLVAATAREKVRVLDFGGGMGIGYAALRGSLPEGMEVDYTVVDVESVCAAGRSLFGPTERVTFASALPGPGSTFDVVYSRSALQYVEDWSGVLRRLLRYRAHHALLVLLTAGHVPTYASAQHNVPGSVLAHWFFDLDEIVGIARAEGYSLIMRTTSDKSLRGQAVPPSHRLDAACNLLFRSGEPVT